MSSNRKLVVIFLVVFVVFSLSAVLLNTIKPETNIAIITIDGEKVREVDTSHNQSFDIVSKNGTNSVIVKDNKIYLTDATCPDKLCVRHGELHNKYDAIVCLPNKVVIEYKNTEDIDAVAGR